jgi:hypothetical protein
MPGKSVRTSNGAVMGILVPSFSFVYEAWIPRKAQIWEKPCSPSLAYTNKDWDFFPLLFTVRQNTLRNLQLWKSTNLTLGKR